MDNPEHQGGQISLDDALNAVRSVISDTCDEIPDRDARRSHQRYLQRAIRNIYALERK